MNVNVTINMDPETKKFLKLLVDNSGSAAPAAKPAGKPVAAAKKPKAAIEDEDDEDLEGDDLESDDEELEDEDETDDEDEDDEEEGLPKADVAKLKSALRAYSIENGKPAAMKILQKYADSADEVTPAQLPKLLKALKV